jgi:branched-chain amino acid transport system substrate-binding protein
MESIRSRRGTFAVLSVAAGLSLLTAACSAPGSGGSSSGSSSGPINVAVIDAQSGELSSLGAWELKGVKLALQQQNDKGGIDGRKFKIRVYDDQGDPTVTTNLARKAVSAGVEVVFGTAESSDALAMEPTLTSAKIPFITSGQSPDLGKTGSHYVFLNSPPSTVFDSTLANYLVNKKHYKKIAMITNNDSYGAGEHDAFLADLKKMGLQPTSDQVVTPDQKDFSSALSKIAQTHPQVLFFGAEEVESGLIAKQARQLGINAAFAGGAPMGTPVYYKTAGASVANGSIVSTPYLGNDTNAQTKAFAAAYKKAYGEEPEFHGAKAYDGAKIVIQALQQTKGAGGQKLADAMHGITYDGLVGHFAFDKNGIGVHKTTIAVIKNGKQIAVG